MNTNKFPILMVNKGEKKLVRLSFAKQISTPMAKVFAGKRQQYIQLKIIIDNEEKGYKK